MVEVLIERLGFYPARPGYMGIPNTTPDANIYTATPLDAALYHLGEHGLDVKEEQILEVSFIPSGRPAEAPGYGLPGKLKIVFQG